MVFAYYSNLTVVNDYDGLLFRVAVAEYSVLCLIPFADTALYGSSCTASAALRGVEHYWRGIILVGLSQGLLDVVQAVGLFKGAHGCTVYTSQAYPTFRRMLKVSLKSDVIVEWFPYIAGDGDVCDILTIEVPGRKCSSNNGVISVHVAAGRVLFLVDSMSTLAAARGTPLVTLGHSEEVEEQEPDNVQEYVQEVWNASDYVIVMSAVRLH